MSLVPSALRQRLAIANCGEGGVPRPIQSMKKETAIPRLGYLLRVLINAASYRNYFVKRGLDKDLDDLAAEAGGRQGSGFELLQSIEDAITHALARDCGNDWAQLFRHAWFRTSDSIQTLAQHLDVTPFAAEDGQKLVAQHFAVPMLSGFLQLAICHRAAPDAERWWSSPFQAWLSFASHQTGVSENALLTNLANEIDADPRTTERWLSGKPVGKLSWPYAPKVVAALGKKEKATETEIHLLTGWLLIACAYQSLPPETREAVRRDFNLRRQQPWALEVALYAISQESNRRGNTPVRSQAAPLLEEIEQLFSARPQDTAALQDNLDRFQRLIELTPSTLQPSYQYIHHWFAARLAALLGKKEAALDHYAEAVSGAWWRAGPNQSPILNEALLYAVGVGDKDAANGYWDKTFMLGLNQRPKRPLDTQEKRRIAFGFERLFYPQKTKDRIPPPFESQSTEVQFSLGKNQVSNPNQKTKYAEGRTRRTPLMVAIQEGTLDAVQQLIAAGGNPDDCIPESGEGPLSYAMRRACDRKDTAIMDYLLSLKLSRESVNRPASTMRETPLKIAIEMANASAVARLIELGADVEQPCDYLPSALCYAMVLLHGSIHRDDPTQELAYFSGKTPADAYDAKEGAVLDVDLAHRRLRQYDLKNASTRNRQIFDEVLDYFVRPTKDHRAVVRALLVGGADANCRYRVESHHLAEWTPTLFAVQIGDLEVFKMLVEHQGENRGNPELTLMSPSTLERFDALWVAIDHGRHAIVSYLLGREKRSGTIQPTPGNF